MRCNPAKRLSQNAPDFGGSEQLCQNHHGVERRNHYRKTSNRSIQPFLTDAGGKGDAAKEQEKKLNALQKGFVTEGVIERIEPYGCFVTIGDGLSGLVHISQICNKFLHSPNEVVKLGQTVKVKVLDVTDGKIRLSMKEAEDIAPEVEEAESIEYHDEEATTSLASLLAGIHFED